MTLAPLLLIAAPALPLAASLAILASSRQPRRARRTGGGVALAVATAVSLAALLALHGREIAVEGRWFETGGLVLTLGLELNGLTWFAAVLVAAVSLLVTVYSLGYMADEPDRPRFFAELGFFVGAMLTLVLSSSLVLLFAAWEAVGLASYLLIGFRHRETCVGAAAAKAFLMTRIGDFGFLLGWLLAALRLHTTDIGALLRAAGDGTLEPVFLSLVALLIFAAAIGKSAQLPLTVWLPDAMVAPTPVSALLHSATMVAAGVYLLLRLYPLFAAAPGALDVVFWTGGVTALVAALAATAEMDLKRVLAWSTVSQLGEMMIAVGLGAPLAAALHLLAHACFKSTLFLAAGVVDKRAGMRDLRRLGGLWRALPVTTLCFLVAALSLAGVQPLLTSTSHDAILAAALRSGSGAAFLVALLLFLAGVYIARAGVLVFTGSPISADAERDEPRWSMLAGMVVLAVASALISVLIAAAPAVLPFGTEAETPRYGRAAALIAGVAGLVFGAWRARRHRVAPALGFSSTRIERLVAGLARQPTVGALAAARRLGGPEAALDRSTGALGTAFSRAGGRLLPVEDAIDAVGKGAAMAIWSAALGAERAESRGFGAGGDRLADRLQGGGERLRPVQSGKLYLYTLGIFAWALLVGVAGGLALWR